VDARAEPSGNRIAVAFEARALRKLAEAQDRSESESLERLGAVLSHEPCSVPGAQAQADAVRIAQARLAELERRLATSLDADRADYAIATPAARRWVILRGVFDRLALRSRRRALASEVERARIEFGRAGVAAANSEACAQHRDLIRAALTARAAAADRRREREELLRPHGGKALPAWADALYREGSRFGLFVIKELRTRLLPRVPALGAMAMTWWITRMYTDSTVKSWLHDLGLRDDGAWKVSSETMQRLRFWGPLLAAAVVGWGSEYIARRIRARYAPPVAADGVAGSGAEAGRAKGT